MSWPYIQNECWLLSLVIIFLMHTLLLFQIIPPTTAEEKKIALLPKYGRKNQQLKPTIWNYWGHWKTPCGIIVWEFVGGVCVSIGSSSHISKYTLWELSEKIYLYNASKGLQNNVVTNTWNIWKCSSGLRVLSKYSDLKELII